MCDNKPSSTNTALAWSSHSGAPHTSVRTNVESTADKIPGPGTDWVNGRVNADGAVRYR